MATTVILPAVGDTDWGGTMATAFDVVTTAIDANTTGASTKVDARTITGVVAVSAAGTLALNKLTQVDATSGALTMTLPTGAPVGAVLVVEKADAGVNAVTVSGSIRGAASTLTLTLAKESIQFIADTAGSWNPSAGHKTLSSLKTVLVSKADVAFSVKDYGAVADSNGTVGNGTDNFAAYTAAKAAADAAGFAEIHFPRGVYRMSAGITLGKGQVLSGDGAGHFTDIASAKTVLVFDNNVNGVTYSGNGASCQHMMLIGGTGAVNGITAGTVATGAGRTRTIDVGIIRFGQDGYNSDTSAGGNHNIPYCENVRCYQNGRDGFHITGIDSNAGTYVSCEAVANGNAGIYNTSARNSFVGGHLSTNTVDGIVDGGNSNMYDVYVESGVGGTLNLLSGSSYGVFWGRLYAMPTITGSANAATSWTILRNHAFRGQLRISDPGDSVTTGKTWKMDSGNFAPGWFGLTNETDSLRVFTASTTSGAGALLQIHGLIRPDTTGTRDLGSTALKWKDLWLAGMLHMPVYTTATRPTAGAAGAGAVYYDTTLARPQYSNGTVWGDASLPAAGSFGFCRTGVPPSTGIATAFTANTTWYYRVLEGDTITKIRVGIGTQSGNICVATYANNGTGLAAVPGAQTGTSGSIACPATGVQDIALGGPTVVNAGDWLAIGADNVTVKFYGSTGVGSGALAAGQMGTQVAYPPPAPAGTLTMNNNRLVELIGVP